MRQKAHAREQAPSLGEDALLDILERISSETSAVGEDVLEALRLFRQGGGSDPAEYARLEAEGRAEVQAAVASAQASALGQAGLSAADFESAGAYYTTGSGRSVEVLERVAALRRSVGRFFITKGSFLDALRASSDLRVAKAREKLQRLVDPNEVPEYIRSPSFVRLLQEAVENLLKDQVGMGWEELQALSETPPFASVRTLPPPPPPPARARTRQQAALASCAPLTSSPPFSFPFPSPPPTIRTMHS